jgi:hypothetical protein
LASLKLPGVFVFAEAAEEGAELILFYRGRLRRRIEHGLDGGEVVLEGLGEQA